MLQNRNPLNCLAFTCDHKFNNCNALEDFKYKISEGCNLVWWKPRTSEPHKYDISNCLFSPHSITDNIDIFSFLFPVVIFWPIEKNWFLFFSNFILFAGGLQCYQIKNTPRTYPLHAYSKYHWPCLST